MHSSKIVRKSDLAGKRVLVRVDFNVPMEDGVLQDNSRIKNPLHTIKFLKEAGAKIILISHFGKSSPFNPKQSLRNILDEVAKEYNSNIIFIDDCMAENAGSIINDASSESIILMENLRFHPEEAACDLEFAKRLADLADFYINEAFSTSHRRHASIFGIPQFLPHALGLSFARELQIIDNFFSNPQLSRMCIVGGTKLSTKVNLLKNLVKKVDKLALGGSIAGIFLSFRGNSSLKVFDWKEYESEVSEITENAKQYGCELILPIDFSALICENGAFHHRVISSENSDVTIFDIGPNSIELFKQHLRESKVLLWNGPVGLFEKAPFDLGTTSIAKEVAQLTREGKLISIIGGGDTSFAMNKFNVAQDLSHISTAGGAFLAYVEGEELPGIMAMRDSVTLDYRQAPSDYN